MGDIFAKTLKNLKFNHSAYANLATIFFLCLKIKFLFGFL